MSTSIDAFLSPRPPRALQERELASPADVKSHARSAPGVSSKLIDPVDTPRSIMEQRGLLVLRKIEDDRLEAVEDRIEARPQAADGEVAAEHRSIDAEAF